jgi:16S rRNA (guanine966-N2)-methyltransferase
MSDKMRGALFNMLGDIEGLTVLDAFSGSGALAFEAISRGAASAVAIEHDRNAQRAIADNIASLQLQSQVKLIKANASAWLKTADGTFDLVLLDPPYDALQEGLLGSLATRLNSGGMVALSWPGKQEPPEFENLTLQSSKQYGDGSLHLYTAA